METGADRLFVTASRRRRACRRLGNGETSEGMGREEDRIKPPERCRSRPTQPNAHDLGDESRTWGQGEAAGKGGQTKFRRRRHTKYARICARNRTTWKSGDDDTCSGSYWGCRWDGGMEGWRDGGDGGKECVVLGSDSSGRLGLAR